MSQQMNFDEEQRGYQSGYTPSASYEEGPDYRPPVNDPQGYKLGQYQFTPRSSMLTAGQRLALAIVSVAILIPITGILLGDSSMAFFVLVGRLIALGAICLTVMVINYIFNRGH
jgi:hypothetical protein